MWVRGCRNVHKNTILIDWEFQELDSEADGLYLVSLSNSNLDFKISLSACFLTPDTSSWAMDCDLYFNHFMSCLYSIADEADLFYVEAILMHI